jgi:hypothetical protein
VPTSALQRGHGGLASCLNNDALTAFAHPYRPLQKGIMTKKTSR